MSYLSEPRQTDRPYWVVRSGNANRAYQASVDWSSRPASAFWDSATDQADQPGQTLRPVWDHAASLSVISSRDVEALQEWFERDDMSELEADVNRLLTYLAPAPPWNDDAWEFAPSAAATITRSFPLPLSSPIGIGHRFEAYL